MTHIVATWNLAVQQHWP